MKKILSLIAVMGLASSCGEDKETKKEAGANGSSNEPAQEESVSPEDEPAEAGDVPEGFESLKMTKGQVASYKGWLEKQEGIPKPDDLTTFLMTILKPEQQAELKKVMEAAVPKDPNAPEQE